MKNLLLFLLLFTISSASFAQIEDAWVFFTDKENVEESINNPISILTQDAIDRKALHGTPIDARDVPVNENYITQIKNVTGITVYSKSKWMNCVYVKGTQANINNLLDLSFVASVEFANKDLNFSPVITKTEDKFAIENQPVRIDYNYGSAANQIEMLSGDYLHQQDFTGEGMVVAVLDAGFPSVTTNSGFSEVISEGRLLGTYDFHDRTTNVDGTSTHGTKTTSDIVGYKLNQFVGTAPEASLYLYVTEYGPTETPVEEAHWVEALERADSLGVDVINTSLGYQDFDDSSYDHSYEDLDGQTTFSARGANNAFDKGMILVTSAGNDGGGFTYVGTPGDSPGMLTVGAVDSNGNYASFSSIGPTVDGRVKPDVMAQGASSAIINTNGNVDFASGTSFSSPIMAGAVTCLWQSKPEATNAQVMQIVRESAHLYNNPTAQMGYGIPNFEDAYNALQQLSIEDEFLLSNFAIYPNPVSEIVNISFPEQINEAQFTVHSILGNQVINTTISTEINKVNIESLDAGMYIATITSNNQSISFKLIKK
ncbi:MAG: S8 family serine peptidase [Flavobacteriales bacterium]